MTTIQICALIVLILFVGLTYWAGRREGQMTTYAEKNERIRDLERTMQFLRSHRRELLVTCRSLKAARTFGAKEHELLLDIAEKLRIAAETFSAFRTGKKLERDTLALRDQALAMAALLEPAALENAA